MGENIHYYDNKEDTCFDDLTLANPYRLQGGAYFSKLSCNEDPFLFQTPKSFTKKGVILTNKKAYCDLLFTTDNDQFVEWIDNLEKSIQMLIYGKKDLWFNNDMEPEDIEYFFNPSLRLFQKNKYLFRCYIQQPKYIKKPFSLQIYDENENDLTINDLNSEQKLISILEVLGIKFTSSSFHIEFSLRQIMIINEKALFQKCLIKRKNNIKEKTTDEEHKEPLKLIVSEIDENNEEVDEDVKEDVKEDVEEDVKEKVKEEVKEEINKEKNEEGDVTNIEESPPLILSKFKETLKIEHLEKNGEIKEIDIDIMSNDNPIILKKPNEVYLEIYKKARTKAKEAKIVAIRAFLEAKRIKNVYLLDNIEDDSDSLGEFNDYDELSLA